MISPATAVPLGPDFQAGRIVFGGFNFGQQAGPNGSGILATVTFRAKAAGVAALQLQELSVTDTRAQKDAPADLLDATLNIGQK